MKTDIEMRPMEQKNGQVTRWEVVRDEPEMMIEPSPVMSPVAPMVRSTSHIEGSYEDRARGFAVSTWQSSVVTGAGLVIAALVLGGSFSFVALSGWFFTGFCAVWLVSFALHTFVSAEGSEFLSTLFLWRFLEREQAERHRRMGAQERGVPAWVRGLLLAGAVGFMGLFVLLVLDGVAMEMMTR